MFSSSESPCGKSYEDSATYSPMALTVDFSVKSSPFNNGFDSGRQTALDTGYSDDSDLPRLSPIRTSSESALNNLEKPRRRVLRPELMSVPSPALGDRQHSANSSPGWKWNSGWSFSRLRQSVSRSSNFGPNNRHCHLLSDTDEEHMSEWSCGEPESRGSSSTMATCLENSNQELCNRLSNDSASPSSDPSLKVMDDQIDLFSSGFDHVIGSIFGNKGSSTFASTSNVKQSKKTQELNPVKINHRSDIKTPDFLTDLPDPSDVVWEQSELVENSLHFFSMPLRTIDIDIPELISFDEYFRTYQGHQIFEELETLCNECAKTLNRTRVQLTDYGKAQLDLSICDLCPIFDIDGSPSDNEEDDDNSKKFNELFALRYDSISKMVSTMIDEAAEMDKLAIEDISNIVANPINLTSVCVTPVSVREEYIDLMMDMDEAVFFGRHTLQAIHEEGLKKIAKLCACCLQCLLNVSREIRIIKKSKAGRDDQVENTETNFTDNGEELGQELRSFVIRLIHDMESVTAAFLEALLDIGNCYDENLRDSSCGQKAAGLASDMEVDSSTAVTKIQDSFRNLMYLVISSTLLKDKIYSGLASL